MFSLRMKLLFLFLHLEVMAPFSVSIFKILDCDVSGLHNLLKLDFDYVSFSCESPTKCYIPMTIFRERKKAGFGGLQIIKIDPIVKTSAESAVCHMLMKLNLMTLIVLIMVWTSTQTHV